MLQMVATKHCCWGECKSDFRFPHLLHPALKKRLQEGKPIFVINSHAYLLCNQSRHAFRFVCTKRAHDNNCRISNLVCILGACDLTRKVLFCTISEWNKSEFIRKQLRLLRVYNMAPNVGLEITT